MNLDLVTLRQSISTIVQMLTERGLTVTQRGAKAYVQYDKTGTPVRVNIPHLPDTASEGLIAAIQGFIDHEVAHCLFTECAATALSTKECPKLNGLRNVLEDTRIEREMAKKFPGSAFNIGRLQGFYIEEITKPALEKVAGDQLQEFPHLLVPLVRALAGQDVFDTFLRDNGYYEHPLIMAFLEQLPEETRRRIPLLKSNWEALEVARVLKAILYPPAPSGASKGKKRKDDEKSEEGEESDGASKSKGSDDSGSSGSSKKPDDKDGGTEGSGTSESEDDGDADDRSPPLAKKHDSEPEGDPDDSEDRDAAGEGSSSDDEGEDGGESDDAASGDADGEGSETEGEDEDSGAEGAGAGASDAEEPEELDDEPSGDEKEDAAAGAGPAGAEDEDEEGAGGDEEDGDAASSHDDAGDGGSADDSEDPAPASETSIEGGIGSSPPDEGVDDEDDEPSPFVDLGEEISEFEGEIGARIAEEAVESICRSDYRVYTTDYDVIETFEPSEVPDTWLPALDDKTRHMVGVMQKDIERMMAARSQVVKVPGFRSGQLHNAGLHRLLAGDDRIFRRKKENVSKDVAIGLLIDNSGSMRISDKIELAMASGYALSQTLERVGIAHECIGFTTIDAKRSLVREIMEEEERIGIRFTRYEPIYMPIYKSFEERLTPTVRQRFAAAPCTLRLLENIDGECVAIAARRLLMRRESRKVLLVLSDGNPACRSPDYRALFQHLKDTVMRVEKLGVETVGIGILDASVQTFYPKNFVLKKLEELPQKVMTELRRILLGV